MVFWALLIQDGKLYWYYPLANLVNVQIVFPLLSRASPGCELSCFACRPLARRWQACSPPMVSSSPPLTTRSVIPSLQSRLSFKLFFAQRSLQSPSSLPSLMPSLPPLSPSAARTSFPSQEDLLSQLATLTSMRSSVESIWFRPSTHRRTPCKAAIKPGFKG